MAKSNKRHHYQAWLHEDKHREHDAVIYLKRLIKEFGDFRTVLTELVLAYRQMREQGYTPPEPVNEVVLSGRLVQLLDRLSELSFNTDQPNNRAEYLQTVSEIRGSLSNMMGPSFSFDDEEE